ncbi:hypothetical protein V8E52_010086 [Russula decolorans]
MSSTETEVSTVSDTPPVPTSPLSSSTSVSAADTAHSQAKSLSESCERAAGIVASIISQESTPVEVPEPPPALPSLSLNATVPMPPEVVSSSAVPAFSPTSASTSTPTPASAPPVLKKSWASLLRPAAGEAGSASKSSLPTSSNVGFSIPASPPPPLVPPVRCVELIALSITLPGASSTIGWKITGHMTRAGYGYGSSRARVQAVNLSPVQNPRPRARLFTCSRAVLAPHSWPSHAPPRLLQGTPNLLTPSLLTEALSGHTSIFTLFGGQGINEIYFDELQTLFDAYRPFVEPFLASIIDEVLQPLASASQGTSFYEHGLNIISWLSGAFTQYLVAARVSGLSPAELSARFSGASGHSQGLVTAVAVFSSKDDASFLENVQKALKWLFFAGMQGQQLFPVLALEPSVVQDSIDGGEGQPTPMLSVNGLLLKDLQPHISKTNKYLPDNSQISVSLHNGPRNFIVTGPPHALYGLIANLRKIRAPNSSDQSKVEFSNQYLRDAADKVIYQDLNGEELWTAEGLQIPVYHTENGSDLRAQTGSLISSLRPCTGQKLQAYPKVQHMLSTGAGGISGIGPLTARNLDGRGVRVIVIGEKGKGDAEFYSTSSTYDASAAGALLGPHTPLLAPEPDIIASKVRAQLNV